MRIALVSLLALGLPLGAFAVPQEISADDGLDSRQADDGAAVRSEVRIASKNLMRGVTVKVHPDGRVEATVREEDKDTGRKDLQTYTADSIEDFKCRYPEVADKIDLDRLVPRADTGGVAESWEEWKKRFDEEWFWEHGVGKFLKPWMPFAPGPFERWWKEKRGEIGKNPAFGIRIEPVPAALRAQLRLDSPGGLLVTEVFAGSPAEKAGLRAHDLLLKVNGKEIRDAESFRKDVRRLLGRGFELEIIRAGSRQTIRVNSEASSTGL